MAEFMAEEAAARTHGGAIVSPERPSSSNRKRKKPSSSSKCCCSVCGDEFEELSQWLIHTTMQLHCADAEALFVDERSEGLQALNTAVSSTSYEAGMQNQLLKSYATLEYCKLVDRSCIQETIKKELVEPMLKSVKDEVYRRLAKTKDEELELDQAPSEICDHV